MNVRLASTLLAVLAIFTNGCQRPLEEVFDNQYGTLSSLALSLKSPGELPAQQTTKMTTAITQDGAGFRGIEEVYVIPFRTASATPVIDGTARLGSRNVLIRNSTIETNGLVANNNSHLYELVTLPQNMNRVLVYGKSIDDGVVSTKQGKHKNGVLIPYGLENPEATGDISFGLESVLSADESTAIGQIADNMIAALNGVVEVLQSSNDADLLSFLDVFAYENEISICNRGKGIYQALQKPEQSSERYSV